MLDPHFVWLSTILTMFGNCRYAYHTFRGRTQPNRVTWFLWGVIPMIAFFAELKEGVGLQAYMTLATGLGPLVVFVISLLNRQSFWKITRLDIVCGVMSVLALVLWQLSGSGDLAILLSIVADGLAGLPTIIKAWKHPETEASTPFLIGATSAVTTILTIRNWNFATSGFPIYILATCLTLYIFVRFKPGKTFADEKVAA